MRCLEFRHVSHEVSTQVINELPNRLYNCSNIQIDRHVMYRFFTWFLPLFLFGVAGNFIWGNNTTDQVQQLRITTRQKQWPTPTTQQPKTSNRQPSIIIIVIVIIIITINKINISTNINVNVNINISDNRKKKKKKQKGSKNSSKRSLQSRRHKCRQQLPFSAKGTSTKGSNFSINVFWNSSLLLHPENYNSGRKWTKI